MNLKVHLISLHDDAPQGQTVLLNVMFNGARQGLTKSATSIDNNAECQSGNLVRREMRG
jgi:hypothetical protein